MSQIDVRLVRSVADKWSEAYECVKAARSESDGKRIDAIVEALDMMHEAMGDLVYWATQVTEEVNQPPEPSESSPSTTR